MKAIASGNPAVLTLAEADAELQRLTLLKKNHLDEQYVARRSVRDLPGTIAGMSDRLAKLTTDQQILNDHAGDPITIGGRAAARRHFRCSGRQAGCIAAGHARYAPHPARHLSRVKVRPCPASAIPAQRFHRSAIARQSALSRDHQGPRAVLNALERLAGGYGSECDRIRQDLAIAESQLRDYQAWLGKPFVHGGYLSELTALRDQLKAGLSATAQVEGDEAKPTVSELAERIKTLKAAHSIEATPQRVRQKQSSAEEPVTARIRRRTEVARDLRLRDSARR